MKKGRKFWLVGSALVLATLPLATGAAPISSAPSVPFYVNEGWDASWSYNPFASNAMTFSTLVVLPLAYQMRPKDNYDPMLATKWTVTPKAITIDLRSGVKWQNGTPVTSQDVMDTFEIYGAESELLGAENGITNMTAPNSHEVVFTLKAGSNTTTMLQDILGTTLVPSSEYGQFVTPQLLKDDLEANSGGSGAVVSKAAAYTKSVMDRVVKFQPKSLIGNGAYRLTGMTTDEAILKKSTNFYDAGSIHVPEIVVWAADTNPQGWAEMAANHTDYAWTGASVSILKSWATNPYHKTKLVWDWSTYDWYFNSKHYPLNMTGVRQAIAYVLNRPELTEIGNGFMRNDPTSIPTGLQQVIQNEWLTPKELASFNKYSYDPKKAAQILTGLHFKKTASGWLMPNGKPFTLSIILPSGYSGPTISGAEAASELSQFGIKTTATAVEQPGYWTEQDKGQYQISWGWGGWWVMNPIQQFYDSLVNENYTPHESGYNGLGFGPVVDVPGLGKVNITDNLTNDVNNVTNKAEIAKLTLDYARLVNQQLPFLQYNSKRDIVWYSTQYYVDWPTKLLYWNQLGGNANGALALMLMHGFIRPR